MKKLLFFATAVIAMLSAASCQKEMLNSVEGGNAVVTLSVALPEVPQTRAIAQAENADIVYFEVWNSDWTRKLELQDTDYPGPIYSTEVSGRKANIELTLVADQTYNFIFWAQNEACDAYTVDDLKNVKVDYSVMAPKGNNDAFDAYYAVKTIKVNGTINETVVLYRPFAQLNFATTRMETSFGPVLLGDSKVTVKGLATSFNTIEGVGEVENTAAVTFEAKGLATDVAGNVEKLVTNDGSYTWLTMDYMLMMNENDLVEVEASFDLGMDVPVEHKIANVPLKKNYRTNIIGDVFAADANLQIIIDPAFLKQDEDITVGVPEEIESDGNVYNVTKPGHILWLSQKSQENLATFAGKTLNFAADTIDMMGQGFLPINIWGDDVTVLGNGCRVINFSVRGDSYRVGDEKSLEHAGLFGTMKGNISDLHVEDVLVEGNFSAGALVGYIYGSVENCSATDVTINSIPYGSIVNGTFIYDDANNVGGLIGYVGEESNGAVYTILNNKVDGAVLTGYRCIGGIAGTVNANAEVTGNTVTNTSITVDRSYIPYVDASKKVANAGKVVGRMISTDDLSDNTAGDDVTINNVAVVETVEEFMTAIADASTVAINLLPGTYDLDVNHNTIPGLVIKSIFPDEHAVISGKFIASKDVIFENVDFTPSAKTQKALSTSTYGSYVNSSYTSIVTVYKAAATFDGCTFEGLNDGVNACAINYHQEATGKKLIVKNCTFNGKSRAIYSKVLVDVQNCSFDLNGGVPLYVWPRANGNGECTFANNNAVTSASCQLGLLSQTAPFANVVFNVQNNTGVYTYTFAWTNSAKCATDGSVTFADGSKTFNIGSDGKPY